MNESVVARSLHRREAKTSVVQYAAKSMDEAAVHAERGATVAGQRQAEQGAAAEAEGRKMRSTVTRGARCESIKRAEELRRGKAPTVAREAM
jgi:hypothetical protein